MTPIEEVSSGMGLMPKWQLMILFPCLEGSSIKSSSHLYGFRGRSPQQTSSAIIVIANHSKNISSPIQPFRPSSSLFKISTSCGYYLVSLHSVSVDRLWCISMRFCTEMPGKIKLWNYFLDGSIPAF